MFYITVSIHYVTYFFQFLGYFNSFISLLIYTNFFKIIFFLSIFNHILIFKDLYSYLFRLGTCLWLTGQRSIVRGNKLFVFCMEIFVYHSWSLTLYFSKYLVVYKWNLELKLLIQFNYKVFLGESSKNTAPGLNKNPVAYTLERN